MCNASCSCTCKCTVPQVLQVSKPAPSFTATAVMPDGKVKDISLSDYKGKYVVLFFYPLDFTFVCPTEIVAFDKAVEKFKAIGCEIIGASCDSHFTHTAWINTPRNEGGIGKLNYPLIADFTKELTKKYGCCMDEGHPSRGLYIIDGKGILRNITINDPPVGRSVDEIYRLVEAYKFTDEHPGVCPANWKKGDATIDPSDKATFFKSVFG